MTTRGNAETGARGPRSPDEGARGDALIAEARTLARTGAAQRALPLAREAAALAQRGSDERRVADANEVLADAHVGLSAYPEALAHYLAALASWRRQDDRRGTVRCLQGIAWLDIQIGDFAQAMGRLEEALRLLQDQGDAANEVAVHHRLGMVYARLGDLDRARAFHEGALERARALGDQASIATGLNSLGVLFLRTGQERTSSDDLRRARSLFEEAVTIAEAAGDLHLKVLALGNVGSAVAAGGYLEQALGLFAAQLEALRAMHARHDEALCLTNIGEALRKSARAAEALVPLEAALRIGVELQSKQRMLRAWQELSQCQEALGDAPAALESYKQYHRLEQELHSEDAENRARNLVVQLAVKNVRNEADSYRAERDRLAAANVRLSVEAQEDGLTGLANRRHLDAGLERLFAQAAAEGRSLHFAVADIDQFKAINDRHSHAVGDEVLRTVARILRSACRGSDLAGRYGGEEFVLALLDTPGDAARAVCERLRTTVAHYEWERLRPGLAVTMSIGVADAAAHASGTETLAAADAKLYEAKRAGRNCVR
jgi:diguanylate cyclase (GGDEF)-like protein